MLSFFMLFSFGYWLLVDVCGGSGLFDELGCFLWVRHVGHMARLHFDRLGLGALRHHALLVRIDRSVFGGYHVPGGLVLPGGIRNLVGERVGGDRHLRYSHELRLIPWNVCREVCRELVLFYPPKPVAVRFECLGGLRHGLFDRRTALAFIESKGGNIDKRFNVWMIASLGDDGPAIAMADQNDRAAHGVDGRFRVFLVVSVGGLGRLRYRYLVAILLEDFSNPLPAGAIGECTMHQNHIRNMLCNHKFPFRLEVKTSACSSYCLAPAAASSISLAASFG